jgi:hypothetical protein
MGTVFRDAYLKIDRANKHIADLKSALVAQENTYTATIEHHPNGGQSLIHEFPDFENSLRDLSLIVGDAIHNLRSALDFAWRSTISKHLPDKISARTKFPVRDTRQDLESTLHGIEVDTRCKRLFDCVVLEIQPYKGGNNSAIWTLHNLDIFDKHLLPLGLDPTGHIRGISIKDSNGEIHRGSSMPAKSIGGRYILTFESGLHIENKGKLSVTVTLQEAGIYKPVPVLSLLQGFSNFVFHTAQLLENL